MMYSKTLVVLTETYPYIGSETTWFDELSELNKKFKKVIYCPLSKGTGQMHPIPKHVVVISDATLNQLNSRQIKNLKSSLTFVKIILLEMYWSRKYFLHLKKIRYLYSYYNQARQRATILLHRLQMEGSLSEFVYYSTWLNSGALTLSILKEQRKIERFAFRINGYDFMDERHDEKFVFFRKYISKQANYIIGLSEEASRYMIKKVGFNHKIKLNYGGKYPAELNRLDNESNRFIVVSCSNLLPLKRVFLIAETLKYVKCNITWIHFGTGERIEELRQIVMSLPPNICVEVKGYVKQREIDEFYKSNQVNLFIHLSEMEGLGMAIIEAQRYGIPALACHVGGVTDIVNQNTGILIPVDSDPVFIAMEIEKFFTSEKNNLLYRQKVQKNFLEKFNVLVNSADLAELLNNE